jgi:acetolactate synthase I/II/III large subunit
MTEYGSDVVVDILKAYGVPYVSANIGSSFRGVWDSIVNYGGDVTPTALSVSHEEIGVAIAHGYFKANGRPMAVLLHDLVGLQHATMAIFNAWCDRVPVLLLGAAGPMGTERRRPWIDWVHTADTPNTQVRDYVKWDDFPRSVESVPESIIRAYTQMSLEPQAPVYVCFDTAYLEERLPPGFSLPDVSQYPAAALPAANPETLHRTASDLVFSDSPFILAGRVGRKEGAVRTLIKLAELLGASVIDLGQSFCFPNTHPLDATEMNAIGDADAILALDTSMLESAIAETDRTTRRSKLLIKRGARIYDVGLGQFLVSSWAGDYQRIMPAKERILCDTSLAMESLARICSDLISRDSAAQIRAKERLAKAKVRHRKFRRAWQREASRRFDESPVSPPRLALEVWEKIKKSDWVLVHGTLSGWARRLWDWTEPGCFLGGSGGAGLGYGLPASIGAALALKGTGKLAVDLQPDGDLLYSSGALWTAAHYRIPLLIVVFNNRVYHNDAEHNRLISVARGRNASRSYHRGGDLTDPEVDFAALANSYGVKGIGPLERPEQLAESLERAVRTVRREEAPVLVDVVASAR